MSSPASQFYLPVSARRWLVLSPSAARRRLRTRCITQYYRCLPLWKTKTKRATTTRARPPPPPHNHYHHHHHHHQALRLDSVGCSLPLSLPASAAATRGPCGWAAAHLVLCGRWPRCCCCGFVLMTGDTNSTSVFWKTPKCLSTTVTAENELNTIYCRAHLPKSGGKI